MVDVLLVEIGGEANNPVLRTRELRASRSCTSGKVRWDISSAPGG